MLSSQNRIDIGVVNDDHSVFLNNEGCLRHQFVVLIDAVYAAILILPVHCLPRLTFPEAVQIAVGIDRLYSISLTKGKTYGRLIAGVQLFALIALL